MQRVISSNAMRVAQWRRAQRCGDRTISPCPAASPVRICRTHGNANSTGAILEAAAWQKYVLRLDVGRCRNGALGPNERCVLAGRVRPVTVAGRLWSRAGGGIKAGVDVLRVLHVCEYVKYGVFTLVYPTCLGPTARAARSWPVAPPKVASIPDMRRTKTQDADGCQARQAAGQERNFSARATGTRHIAESLPHQGAPSELPFSVAAGKGVGNDGLITPGWHRLWSPMSITSLSQWTILWAPSVVSACCTAWVGPGWLGSGNLPCPGRCGADRIKATGDQLNVEHLQDFVRLVEGCYRFSFNEAQRYGPLH